MVPSRSEVQRLFAQLDSMKLLDDEIVKAWSKAVDATAAATAVPGPPEYYELQSARTKVEQAGESGDRDKLRKALSELTGINRLRTDLVKRKERAVEDAFSARYAAALLTRKRIGKVTKECGLRIDRLCKETLIEGVIMPAMIPREVVDLYHRANAAARILMENVMSLPNDIAAGEPVLGAISYVGYPYRKSVATWAGFKVRETSPAGAAGAV
ncbi:MAG TPA: hypothetical protein VGR67_01785 [Candidatus Polarisedimenticolia bacterium]|jgi:hypothetical protein|nr:hypothetical protein [Candidatus Polarisedimenticolia bacterium]